MYVSAYQNVGPKIVSKRLSEQLHPKISTFSLSLWRCSQQTSTNQTYLHHKKAMFRAKYDLSRLHSVCSLQNDAKSVNKKMFRRRYLTAHIIGKVIPLQARCGPEGR